MAISNSMDHISIQLFERIGEVLCAGNIIMTASQSLAFVRHGAAGCDPLARRRYLIEEHLVRQANLK